MIIKKEKRSLKEYANYSSKKEYKKEKCKSEPIDNNKSYYTAYTTKRYFNRFNYELTTSSY